MQADINDSNWVSAANSNAWGNYIVNRVNSTTLEIYKNAALMTTQATAAAYVRPSVNWVVCGNNSESGVSPLVLDEIASAFTGAAMTSTQALAKNAALNAYMTSVGCNVY